MQRLTHHRQDGFVLPATLLLLLVAGLVTAAAFAAVTGDLPIAKADQQRRSALEAAQAGTAWYTSKLAADPDYWTKCGTVADPDGGSTPPVSGTPWNGSGTDPRKFRAIPGSTASYTIELLPANGKTACSTSDPAGSMLTSNRLRIRATGKVGGKKRSLITTFRRPTFLDYVYFTNYEVLDPDADAIDATTQATCGKWYRDGRDSGCQEIQWGSGDSVLGPLHTNDQLNLCGNPTFGRAGREDRIETMDPTGSRSSCTSSPTYNGLKLFGSKEVAMPPNASSLTSLTQGNNFYSGITQIVLGPTGYRWRNASNYGNGTSWQTASYPQNGLIYVANSGNCAPTTIYSKYDFQSDVNCGNVYVSGTYNSSLTIAAANDVIVTGDLLKQDDSDMLGLVANNYVRVFHPVDNFTGSTCNTSNANSTTSLLSNGNAGLELPWRDPVIQAGILAVNHSWIVDNYKCGSPLGALNVSGTIAQKYRGPVATVSNQTIQAGYNKSYSYDDRFAYRQPPNFLDPIRAAWILARQNEQQPAT